MERWLPWTARWRWRRHRGPPRRRARQLESERAAIERPRDGARALASSSGWDLLIPCAEAMARRQSGTLVFEPRSHHRRWCQRQGSGKPGRLFSVPRVRVCLLFFDFHRISSFFSLIRD